MSKTFQLDPGTRIGLRRSLLCLAIFMMSGITAIGQLTTATITGTVTDQSGAAIPGVAVTIKNVETGISRSLVTNEVGRYDAVALPAGTYELTGSLAGFNGCLRVSATVAEGRVVSAEEASIGAGCTFLPAVDFLGAGRGIWRAVSGRCSAVRGLSSKNLIQIVSARKVSTTAQ